MNRLWVRLSFVIAGVLLSVFFLQFMSIMLDGPPDRNQRGRSQNSPTEDRTEIARRLLNFAALSALVGLVGGIAISRAITKPISQLAQATRQIGKGERAVRLPERGSLELRQLTHAFNQMTDDLQKAETLRSNLMADVSHELRTPLTALEGSLRAALDRVYVLDESEIANLYGQTRHLIRLVNDLHDLALAEQDHLPLDKHPTDLNELVKSTFEAIEPLAAEKNVELQLRLTQLPTLNIDAIRIRQVLFNLLTNAIRHTPANGQVILDGKTSAAELRLAGIDSGEGVDAEQLAVIFNRFYRGDASRSRDTGGTGLGLAIVKALVQAHHGQVEAHSAGKGHGCTFTVILNSDTPAG